MLSIRHDDLTDSILGKLGLDNVAGGLKRLDLKAVCPNTSVTNQGWCTFVGNKLVVLLICFEINTM